MILSNTTAISLPSCLIISPTTFRLSSPLSSLSPHRPRLWTPRAGPSSSSSSSNDDDQATDDKFPSTNSLSSGGTSKNVAPWTLMGRVLQEDKIRPLMNQDYIQQGLIRSAAAMASNLELEEFESRLADLLIIMPFLQQRIVRMKPALLAALAVDVGKTAERMITLKNMLSGANIESILSQRPSLVLDEEWNRIPDALTSLRKYYGDDVIADMASKEPILLIEDVENILKELERLVPSSIEYLIPNLRANPNLASQVKGLRDLSLW